MIQNNERLKERLDYVEEMIGQIRSQGKVTSVDEFIHMLNTATKQRILSLNHIGQSRARGILEMRTKKPFSSVEDLEEIGMNWKRIRNLLRDNNVL